MAYEDIIVEVPGKVETDIFLFTLSTCIWCKKTKALLAELGANYRYVDADLAEGEARTAVLADLEAKNPETSFPTIVFDGERVELGFAEEEIREYVKSR